MPYFEIDLEYLKELLGLPDDVKIIKVSDSSISDNHSFFVKFHSPDLPENLENAKCNPVFCRQNGIIKLLDWGFDKWINQTKFY